MEAHPKGSSAAYDQRMATVGWRFVGGRSWCKMGDAMVRDQRVQNGGCKGAWSVTNEGGR
jgi:hypothetical protein